MPQTLYLLRHAKADPWSPGIDDFNRGLSERGHEHMLHLADWIRDQLPPPDRILCSSARRTRETLEPLNAAWPDLEEKTIFTRDIYEASTGTLHELAGQAFRDAQTILMVGHNPGFESLALAALCKQDATGIDRMSTGTLAVIDFKDGYDESAGNGGLRQWIRRKNLSID